MKKQATNWVKERIKLSLVSETVSDEGFKTLLFDVILNESGETIGSCSAVLGHSEKLYYSGNIGFSIKEEHRGNGYAVEVVNLLKKVFNREGIDFIHIVNSPDNQPCIRVCEKLGSKLIKLVEVPTHLNLNVDDNENYKNIWELKF